MGEWLAGWGRDGQGGVWCGGVLVTGQARQGGGWGAGRVGQGGSGVAGKVGRRVGWYGPVSVAEIDHTARQGVCNGWVKNRNGPSGGRTDW